MGYVLMEHRNGLMVAAQMPTATGIAACEAAVATVALNDWLNGSPSSI
jgi:hypothetical protein